MCCYLGAVQANCEPAGLAERAGEVTNPALGEELYQTLLFLAVFLQQNQEIQNLLQTL